MRVRYLIESVERTGNYDIKRSENKTTRKQI